VFDSTFFDSDFISTLKKIQQEYLLWLGEMADQDRKFTPFILHKDPRKVFDLVKGITTNKKFIEVNKNYDLFNSRLNGQGGSSKIGSREQQFVELFYLATQQLVNDKFNIE
jgi:hypothetical protein